MSLVGQGRHEAAAATTFQARFPSPAASNLLAAHIARRVVWAYIALSVVAWPVSTALGAPGATTALAAAACTAMALVTVAEFDVCGARSFVFSSAWFLVFFALAYLPSGSWAGVERLLVVCPWVWASTSGLTHFVASCLIVPGQIVFNGLNGHLERLRAYDPAALAQQRQLLIDQHNGERVVVSTPDGARVSAVFFASARVRHLRQASPHGDREPRSDSSDNGDRLVVVPGPVVRAPAVILFNGNSEAYEFKGAEVGAFLKQGFAVLVFNYRGVCESKGWATRDGLMLDAESCFQFLNQGVGVPTSLISLAGTSLGGAIATEIAAMHPGCTLCNDRSFASLAVEVGFVGPDLVGVDPKTGKGRALGAALATLTRFSGWEFNAVRHWRHVRGPKFVMFHPGDTVIPEGARLVDFVADEAGVRVLRMQPGAFDRLYTAPGDDLGQVAHCRPLVGNELAQFFSLLTP